MLLVIRPHRLLDVGAALVLRRVPIDPAVADPTREVYSAAREFYTREVSVADPTN